jgi:hypothetical protein
MRGGEGEWRREERRRGEEREGGSVRGIDRVRREGETILWQCVGHRQGGGWYNRQREGHR